MADVQLAQGMARPGAWTVGGVLLQQSFTDPKDAHIYIPEMWSDAATRAHEDRARIATFYQGHPVFRDIPRWAVTTGMYQPTAWAVTTRVADLSPVVTASHCLICGQDSCMKVHQWSPTDSVSW